MHVLLKLSRWINHFAAKLFSPGVAWTNNKLNSFVLKNFNFRFDSPFTKNNLKHTKKLNSSGINYSLYSLPLYILLCDMFLYFSKCSCFPYLVGGRNWDFFTTRSSLSPRRQIITVHMSSEYTILLVTISFCDNIAFKAQLKQTRLVLFAIRVGNEGMIVTSGN